MTVIILLIGEDVRLIQQLLKLLMRRISVMKQTKHSITPRRYELMRGEDADFIVYIVKRG
jgi:hypothetical protein